MKTKLFLFISLFTLLSCNKDDDSSERQLTVNYENMSGDWEYKTIIRPNGSEEAYPVRCETYKDFIRITLNASMTSYNYYSNCVGTSHSWDGYYFEGNMIKNGIDDFDEARVTSLTSTTMRVEYDTPTNVGTVEGLVKVLILKKR